MTLISFHTSNHLKTLQYWQDRLLAWFYSWSPAFFCGGCPRHGHGWTNDIGDCPSLKCALIFAEMFSCWVAELRVSSTNPHSCHHHHQNPHHCHRYPPQHHPAPGQQVPSAMHIALFACAMERWWKVDLPRTVLILPGSCPAQSFCLNSFRNMASQNFEIFLFAFWVSE